MTACIAVFGCFVRRDASLSEYVCAVIMALCLYKTTEQNNGKRIEDEGNKGRRMKDEGNKLVR